MGDGLPVWVLYESPADYPGEWVVRRQVAHVGVIQTDHELAVRGPDRETCEKILFERYPEVRGLVWLPRNPNDDPVIVGTWM